jgi:hypothetical protein
MSLGFFAAASLFISVVTSAVQYQQQAQQAQDAANRARRQAEEEAALREAELAQLEKEQAQKEAVEKFDRRRQLRKQQGQTVTGRAEAGVMGNSVLTELQTNILDASYDIGIIDKNRENQSSRNEITRGFIDLNRRTKIENSKAPSVSGLAIGAGLASSALEGFAAGAAIDESLE